MTLPGQPLLVLGMSTWAGALGAWLAIAADAGGWLLAAGALAAAAPLLVPRRARVLVGILAFGVLAGGTSAASHLIATRPAQLLQWVGDGETVEALVAVRLSAVEQGTDIGDRASSRVIAVVEEVRQGPSVIRPGTPTTLLGGADVLGAPDRGSRMTVTGRLLPEIALRETGLAISVDQVLRLQPPGGWSAAVAAARGRMWQALDGVHPDAASLVAGLAIGDDSRQSSVLGDAMRSSGLSHLTAVSGGNVAIVCGLVVGAAALAGASLRLRLALGLVAIIAYAAFVGPEPSVLRAAVMGAVALVGLMRGARGGGFPLLGLAVFALIVARPGLALSWGFALSVSATWGILALAPHVDRGLAKHLPRVRGSVLAAVSVTVAAQAATAPLVAAMTGTLSLVAVPANLAAAPLVAPITVLGLALTVCGVFAPPLAGALARLVEPFGILLALIARWSADVPHGTVQVPSGPIGAAGVCVCLAGAGLLLRRLGPRPTAVLAAAGLMAVMLLGRDAGPPRDWIAAACDIGQGDAYLVRTGPRAAVLIDTGPGAEPLARCLRQMRVSRIDLLVLTHFDTDHVAATPAVLRRFAPDAVLASPVAAPKPNADAVRHAAAQTGTPVLTAQPGQRLLVGQVRLTVLWPRRVIRDGSLSNNAAVATAVEAGGLRLLFTGDLEPLGQSGLMAAQPAQAFDVVTIPHHGSANQHPDFLAWTGAQAAWVSAGRGNTFGHPRPEALRLAAQAGAAVGRTDRQGTIALVNRGGQPVLVPLSVRPAGG